MKEARQMTDKGREAGGDGWQERAAKLFCLCVYTAGAYLALTYLLPAVLPFAVAFCVAAAVSGAARRVSRGLRLPYALCAVLLVTVLLLLLGLGVFYACRQVLTEIKRTLSVLSADDFSALAPVFDLLDRIPMLSGVADISEKAAEGELYAIVSEALSLLGGAISSFLGRALKATPSVFLGGVVTVVSCYYMSIDFERICGFLGGLMPARLRNRAGDVKNGVLVALLGYVKAYGILFVLTFCEVLAGLLILCPSHAWLGALAVAAIDVLPVLGAGFVLIPWGVVSLLSGEHFLGIGLLVLYVIITVVRQIAEPKVIGESAGLHPLGAMIAMFAGYRLFGFSGMLLAPIVLTVAGKVGMKRFAG